MAAHMLIVLRLFSGLISSGLCWCERLFLVLLEMGFMPSLAENDIWMRPMGDNYEYISMT